MIYKVLFGGWLDLRDKEKGGFKYYVIVNYLDKWVYGEVIYEEE